MDDILNAIAISLETGLFWDELMHGAVALLFSIFIYTKTQKIKFAVVPLIMAYALDTDHLVDYWVHWGFGFSLSKFVEMEYFTVPGRAFVPFHAWEWVFLLLPFSLRKGWKSYITSINLGLAAHLIWDTITVGSVLFYFIIYRYLIGFRIFN